MRCGREDRENVGFWLPHDTWQDVWKCDEFQEEEEGVRKSGGMTRLHWLVAG
jgi:hypothetical protein